jgi:hypothetical protein
MQLVAQHLQSLAMKPSRLRCRQAAKLTRQSSDRDGSSLDCDDWRMTQLLNLVSAHFDFDVSLTQFIAYLQRRLLLVLLNWVPLSTVATRILLSFTKMMDQLSTMGSNAQSKLLL